MTRIAILGAGGFLGSNLVEHLLDHTEHLVLGVDVTDEKLGHISHDRFTFVKADIAESDADLTNLVAESDTVVDMVAIANPSMYVASPLETYEINFTQNMRVVDACVGTDVHLVQCSTAEVYGYPIGDASHEDSSPLAVGPIGNQRWIYSASKQLLERVIHAHGLNGDLTYTIVRPFNVIGPRLDYLVPAGAVGGPRVFAHFMSALFTGGPFWIVDGGSNHRAFTHIDDCNRAFQTVIEDDRARGEIFNIGNPGNNATIREVADLMLNLYHDLTGQRPTNQIVDTTAQDFYGDGYEDVDRVPPAIDKLGALGWEPVHGLEATFRDAMAYYIGSDERSKLVA